VLRDEELEEWKKFRIKNGDQPDPKLDTATAIYYYFYSIGSGAVGISNYVPVTRRSSRFETIQECF